MKETIDVTKLPGYIPSIITDKHAVAVRHACGTVLYADLESEYPVFYGQHSISLFPYDKILVGARALKGCPNCHYPLNMDWMRDLYLVEPMEYYLAVLTVSRRVCSHCWGQLTHYRAGKYEIVLCHQCTYDTIGYVSHRFVDNARMTDRDDYEVCANGLSEALEIEIESDPAPVREKLTRSGMMQELGF